PTPCGQTIEASAGQPVSFPVIAGDPDEQDLALNSGPLPPGATMTPPLPAHGNPVISTFNWAPTAADDGTHTLTFFATDGCGAQVPCTIFIHVTSNRDP